MASDFGLSAEWRYASIGELEQEGTIAEIQDGNHGERHPTSLDYVSSGIPFVMAKDLVGGTVNLVDCAFIPKKLADSLRIGFARPGDVLLTHKATMGRVAIVPEGFDYVMLTPQVTYYRIGNPKQLLNKYLKYAFLGPDFQYQLNSDSEQSTRKYIGITSQRRLRIPVPPLAEQRAISQVLSTLDDKIQLNKYMKETLEGMADAIYRSWFVDFEPIRAKAEGRDTGLPRHISDLFPDEFEDSELGEIPRGWKTKNLAHVTSYLSRGISPAYVEEGGVLVLNQKCIRDRSVDYSKARRHDPKKKSIDGRALKIGDVLVNSTGVGTLGRVAQVLTLREETIVDSHVTIVRANDSEMSWNFLGIDLSGREQQIEALGEGSTGQTELSRSRLANLLMITPNPSVLKIFDHLTLPIRLLIAEHANETLMLVEIRNALLPKLVSGELRIKHAERIVGGIE